MAYQTEFQKLARKEGNRDHCINDAVPILVSRTSETPMQALDDLVNNRLKFEYSMEFKFYEIAYKVRSLSTQKNPDPIQ